MRARNVLLAVVAVFLSLDCGCEDETAEADGRLSDDAGALFDGSVDSAIPGADAGPGLDACCEGADVGADGGPDGGGVADAGADGGGGDASEPYLPLDPSPFGFHPAKTIGLPEDSYTPALEAGVRWAREAYVFWSIVDPDLSGDPARMRFDLPIIGPDGKPVNYDQIAAESLAAGFNLMWHLAPEPVPGGAAMKPGSWLPIDETAYARFVETAVARYPRILVWQVWNEPNIMPDRSRTDFAGLQRLTYEAVKRANPEAVVVMGGVAGNMTVADWKDDYFDAVLDGLGGCCMDVFDFHFYGDPVGGKVHGNAPYRLLGYSDVEDVAAFYRARLDSRGYSAARLWNTENGTPSGTWQFGPETITATEAEQARDLPKRGLVALASGVDKVFWAFGMNEGFGEWDDDFFDHTGLVYSGHGAAPGAKKLGYWAYWQMTRQLDGCRWKGVERILTGVSETRAYRCQLEGGGNLIAAWWDTFNVPDYKNGDTVDVAVPWPAQTAVVRSAVPSFASGAEVTDPTTAFATSTLLPSGGEVTLTLGADPVYVREE